jgi:hypothetical protein
MAEKYITLEDGCDFRQIAEKMSEAGWEMNHATARNVLMSATSKLIKSIANDMGAKLTEEELYSILKNQVTHDSLQEILYQAYKEISKE